MILQVLASCLLLLIRAMPCQAFLLVPLTSSQTADSVKRFGHQQVAELVTGSIPWNSIVGQADRAFRLGITLEKNGQSRKASAAFHEAATLYQCFLDSKAEFGHVTCLDEDDCSTILAYACLRLGFLNLDALGDPLAAVRLFKEAAVIDPFPSAVTYKSIGESVEAARAGKSLLEAIDAYRTCLKIQPENKNTQFNLAVALDRLGQASEAEELLEGLRRSESHFSCLVDSWGYVRWHTRKIPNSDLNLYLGSRDMLNVALEAARPLIHDGGLVCEFGVGSGRSIRFTQELLPLDVSIHGFDTFTGLPQAWGNEPAGSYSTGGRLPNLENDNVYFHKGLFSDTIAPFLEESGDDSFLAYANIDCDLYSSTLDILEAFHGRVVPGTVLIFDEYICHPSWRQDEFRAFRECSHRFGWKYEYLAFSLSSKQTVVRLLEA